ncbi:hypothetical protein DERF_014951 [Dermatophagoides farinae]|uniref:Uncharacterized protein n=1 Tax=Dermatophagoides farinae TaxID=6954 RepID=A0A922HKB3_DERFA|nr:hypothetical protein DERF_014951 [Dermatophagoides farinae]
MIDDDDMNVEKIKFTFQSKTELKRLDFEVFFIVIIFLNYHSVKKNLKKRFCKYDFSIFSSNFSFS